MGTVNDVLEMAASQLGLSDGAKYFNELGAPDYGYWCVAYLRWCYAKANVGFPWHRWDAWDLRDVPQAYMVLPQNALIGDAMSFDWDVDGKGDHVGIIESVHDWGFGTLEGNTGNPPKVMRRQRTWNECIVGIRPVFDYAKLEVDGYFGPLSVSALQRYLGTTVDGVISNQLYDSDKYRPNLTSFTHGMGGSECVWALQERIGAERDGYWGRQTSNYLQIRLRKYNYYNGYLDNVFGPTTAKALQRALNDGVF